jgi:hypothetical protein
MILYQCRNEDGELMRSFGRKEEALAWVANRQGWTVQSKRVEPKQTYIPEEAPF